MFWFAVLDHGNVVFFVVRSNSQEEVTETHSMCRLGGTLGAAGRLRMNRTTFLSHSVA
jgi:hypothetical protein